MIVEITNLGQAPIRFDTNEPCPHCAENAKFSCGDRVAFYHLIFGDQTGTIHHLLNSEPPRAIVHIDHRLRNVFWSVPLADLVKESAVPA